MGDPENDNPLLSDEKKKKMLKIIRVVNIIVAYG